MNSHNLAESLHRLVKQALDSGAASSVAEAEAVFNGYRLAFTIDSDEACDPLHQAALLTGVALARRVFLGGVTVDGDLAMPLELPLPFGATLQEAVVALGGIPAAIPPHTPIVNVGNNSKPRAAEFHIRTAFSGWRGGILPVHSEIAMPSSGSTMPLAPMLSAALAVNEAFLAVSDKIGAAGRRAVGLSLWNPSPEVSWIGTGDDEPALRYLPSQLWLIGLGHLGQAFMWGLGLLPYPRPSDLTLVLQDVDRLTQSSMSTSILTDLTTIGFKKTRAMATWAERRGFNTIIHERLFDSSFRRQANEPAVALCGIDNALGRRALDQVGFDFVVEAGLGRGYRDFRSLRLHTLPGLRSAKELWKGAATKEDIHERVAYQRILQEGGLDQCGITLLAGKAVGAPFVGSVAACLVLSEVLRLLHGGPLHHVVELDLQSVDQRTAIHRVESLSNFNPSFVDTS